MKAVSIEGEGHPEGTESRPTELNRVIEILFDKQIESV